MKIVAPRTFEYARPKSVAQVLELLGPGTTVLAGGTDLVTMRADGRIEPSSVVDIKAVSGLSFVEHGADGVRVGATTTMAELAAVQDPELMAVVDGAAIVGSVQTRNRATLGGNVCRSSPAGDTLPGLLVLDAVAVAEGPAGDRRVPLREFFTGPGLNALAKGELLTAVAIPLRGGGGAYSRLTYRAWMDLAVMGVAARIRLDGDICAEAAIAIGGMAPTPLLVDDAARTLVGTSLGDAELAAAADTAAEACSPIDDVRGSREYRLQGLRALLPRVVATARARSERSEPR
jgi:CO/xanthine dehydrogenase FAD-binding subunit